MITITCKRCGSRIVSKSVPEAIAWNDSHDAVCPKMPNDGQDGNDEGGRG